ncbi:hypothetical protein BD414DRAFT_523133, partial [Trametes punicea]
MSRQLRIAIALTALQHKPSTQSIQSYIADLQTAFSPTCACRPIQPGAAPPEPWRERAVTLEKEMEGLRAQHDQERLELLALRKAAQSQESRPTPEEGSAPSTAAKKAKGKKTKASSAVEPSAGFTPASVTTTLPIRLPRLDLSAFLQRAFA